MSKFLDFVKNHPIGLAIGAAAVVGGYYLLSAGSGGATGTDNTAFYNAEAASVQAGQQFQTAQLQANQAALVSNNQAAVANNQITAQQVVAALQSQDTLAGISATAATKQNEDTLSAQTTQAVSLLQAQVAENQTAAAVQEAQINANAYVSIATASYQSTDYLAKLQSDANAAGNSATIASLTAQNQKYASEVSQINAAFANWGGGVSPVAQSTLNQIRTIISS